MLITRLFNLSLASWWYRPLSFEAIRLELAEPVQRVRDIHNQDKPEEALGEYLRLLADHLESAIGRE